MMTILVVFLLAHTAEVDILPNTKNISIPQSLSDRKPSAAVVVMVTKDSVYVDGQPVGTIAQVVANPGPVFQPLKAALMAQNDKILAGAQKVEIAKREVTIMGDKDIPYSVSQENHVDLQRRRVRQGVLRRGRAREGGTVSMATAANPAQRPATPGLAPYYRRYELPWSPSEEMERRFRRILRNLVIVFADHRGDHALPAAAREGGEYRFAAGTRGAVRHGAPAAPAAAPAAEARAQKPAGEGAGDAEAGAARGCAREGLEERSVGEHGRSGGPA